MSRMVPLVLALLIAMFYPMVYGFKMSRSIKPMRLSSKVIPTSSQLHFMQRLHTYPQSSSIFLSSTDGESEISSESATVIGSVGVVANLVMAYSLYTLKMTGCGLPPGPYGLEGLVEGISYLVVIGIAGWSVKTKVTTGSGLPAGPSGLLGAAEGLSFLSILAGTAIAGLNYVELGYLPGFLPNDKCYGN